MGIKTPPTSPAHTPTAGAGSRCRNWIKTSAATTPKMNCDAMNQGQLTPLLSAGLTTAMKLNDTAVQNTGISAPPQASGLRISGNVGKSTPYNSPSVADIVTCTIAPTANSV